MNYSIPHLCDRATSKKERRSIADKAILQLCLYNRDLVEHNGKMQLTEKGRQALSTRPSGHRS